MKSISYASRMIIALRDDIKTQTRRNGEPKYAIGDILYVKEAIYNRDGMAHFAADDASVWHDTGVKSPKGETLWARLPWHWKVKRLPSIYCPQKAARFHIEITRVRREKIADISLADARAEGFDTRADFVDYFAGLNSFTKEQALEQIVTVYDFKKVTV